MQSSVQVVFISEIHDPRNIALKYTNDYPMYQYSRDCFEYTFFQTVKEEDVVSSNILSRMMYRYTHEKDANTMSNSLTLLLSSTPLLAFVSNEPQYRHAVMEERCIPHKDSVASMSSCAAHSANGFVA